MADQPQWEATFYDMNTPNMPNGNLGSPVSNVFTPATGDPFMYQPSPSPQPQPQPASMSMSNISSQRRYYHHNQQSTSDIHQSVHNMSHRPINLNKSSSHDGTVPNNIHIMSSTPNPPQHHNGYYVPTGYVYDVNMEQTDQYPDDNSPLQTYNHTHFHPLPMHSPSSSFGSHSHRDRSISNLSNSHQSQPSGNMVANGTGHTTHAHRTRTHSSSSRRRKRKKSSKTRKSHRQHHRDRSSSKSRRRKRSRRDDDSSSSSSSSDSSSESDSSSSNSDESGSSSSGDDHKQHKHKHKTKEKYKNKHRHSQKPTRTNKHKVELKKASSSHSNLMEYKRSKSHDPQGRYLPYISNEDEEEPDDRQHLSPRFAPSSHQIVNRAVSMSVDESSHHEVRKRREREQRKRNEIMLRKSDTLAETQSTHTSKEKTNRSNSSSSQHTHGRNDSHRRERSGSRPRSGSRTRKKSKHRKKSRRKISHADEEGNDYKVSGPPSPRGLQNNPFSDGAVVTQKSLPKRPKHRKYNETPVWTRNPDGTVHRSLRPSIEKHFDSRSSPARTSGNNISTLSKPIERTKGKQASLPLPKSAVNSPTNNRSHSATLLAVKENNNGTNIPYYKKEAVSKTDKSFWPYYRLISDISRSNSQQLLQSIDAIFGLDSLQQVLSSFMIERLRDSLNLEETDLLYLPPKEIMRDNDNTTYQSMRNAVPSSYHPSHLDLSELLAASPTSPDTNSGGTHQKKRSLQLISPSKATNMSTLPNNALPTIHSPNETDAKLEDEDNFAKADGNNNSKSSAKSQRERPTPIDPDAATPTRPSGPPGRISSQSSATTPSALANSVTSPTGDQVGNNAEAQIEAVSDEKASQSEHKVEEQKTKALKLQSAYSTDSNGDRKHQPHSGDITPYVAQETIADNNSQLENVMAADAEIGYRIVSFLEQRSFICAHQICRIFLYCCRLPRARSHLMIRVGKVSDKMPISVSEFLKSRMPMLLHIHLLHLVIDKPKWDVLKILLSKLTQLRQLDLMLPALPSNYLMPTKMLAKSVKMHELKILRISGPRKLKLSQQYPDISFLLKDLLKKIKMPNLDELWLMRVASKEKGSIKKFLSEHKDTLKSLELELSVSMDNSLAMLKEIQECAQLVTAGKTPLKSLSFRLIRDHMGLFAYQQDRLREGQKKQKNGKDAQAAAAEKSVGGIIGSLFSDNANSIMSPKGAMKDVTSPISLFEAINVGNRINPQHMQNDEELFKQILDENEYKLKAVCAKIVNELSDKACFERLVYPGNVGKIHWNAINRLQTLRNLHIIIRPSDMLQGLAGFCTQCGHTLTNLKLTVHGIGSDADSEKTTKSKKLSVAKIEQDLVYHLNKNLKECTKLRHVRLVIGDWENHHSLQTNDAKQVAGLNEIGRVSIDSFCRFMIAHCSTLSTVELQCYYLTFDLDKLKQRQSDKIGVSSKFYIPNVKQEMQERLEDLFFSCKNLKRIRIQHATSHRKFVSVQRLFDGKPHTVGVENLDHFVENPFL